MIKQTLAFLTTASVITYRGFLKETEALTSFNISQSVRCVLIGLFELQGSGVEVCSVACHPQPADTDNYKGLIICSEYGSTHTLWCLNLP